MSIRSLGFVLAAGLGLSAAVPALAMHHEKMEAAFKAADKDGDGTLDREEAKAMPRIAKHFDRIDADKSGTLSLDEIGAAADRGRKTHDKMKEGHEKGKAHFTAADKDNDGSLDREEAKAMPHVAKHFDRIDADKSGTVTVEELRAFMKQHMNKHRRDRGDREDRDTDRDDDKDGR